MRPTIAAADTIRTLIAAVPDDRLRELFLEFALAALAVPAVEEPKPAARNGRRRGRGKGWRHGKGQHKIDRHRRAYLDALNAKATARTRSTGGRRRCSQAPRPQTEGQRRRSSRQWRDYLRRGAVGARPQARGADALAGGVARAWCQRLGRPVRSPQSSHATERQPRGRGPIPHTVKMGSFA
jgi:hypothetical protein